MTCRKENVILDLPWLKKANSTVNWTIQTLVFNESIDKLQEFYHCHTTDTARYSSYYLPTPWLSKHVNMDMVKEDHLGSYLNQETESQYICHALDNPVIHWIISIIIHIPGSQLPGPDAHFHHSWKWRSYPSSSLTLCQSHWHITFPLHPILLYLWSSCFAGTPIYEWLYSSSFLISSLRLATYWGHPHL